jgi:hypothetical protein
MARAARPGRRPATGAAVPASFRTDAECPTGQDVPAADHDTVVRAADYLLGPPTGQACEAVWFPPRTTQPSQPDPAVMRQSA